MDLTEAQRRAVGHDGRNLQLIACAGSGKTEVVARRVVHLLTPRRLGSLQPRNIIAFTFTEKAAAELKERIVTRTQEVLGEIHGMADLFVGTIHAFCLDLLRAEAPEYLKYEVLNEVQQALFVDRHSRKSGLTASTDLQGRRLKRYVDTNHYVNALAILREADLDDSKLDGCSVAAALDGYRDLLRERSHFDYSSILEAAVESLTTDDDLRRRLAERLRYVIVDEYQDVNPMQEAIVWSLHDLGARVCVVGDDDQTIYQWRGSDVTNILTFSDHYPEVDRIRLDDNFRSSRGIVDLKSSDRAQAEAVTETQLHVYALAYQELTGRNLITSRSYGAGPAQAQTSLRRRRVHRRRKGRVPRRSPGTAPGRPARRASAPQVPGVRLPRHVHGRPQRCARRHFEDELMARRKTTRKTKAQKTVTRYTYAQVKEPRIPETGHTALLPGDEQVVTLPMDNGWSRAIDVGRLAAAEDGDPPVVVDMNPAADPVLFWAGKRNRPDVPLLPLQRNEIVSESRIAGIIERARLAAAPREDPARQQHCSVRRQALPVREEEDR